MIRFKSHQPLSFNINPTMIRGSAAWHPYGFQPQGYARSAGYRNLAHFTA